MLNAVWLQVTNKSINNAFSFDFSFQALESQLSRLTCGANEDMEKAKELLNSSDEAIPLQICRDLASARLELETNFSAVSQLCAEKRCTLMQAMETGRVSVFSLRREGILGKS